MSCAGFKHATEVIARDAFAPPITHQSAVEPDPTSVYEC